MDNINVNEQSNLEDIARQVRKGVNRLLTTYFSLILGAIVLFALVVAVACFLFYAMLKGGHLYGRAITLLIGVIIIAGVCVRVVLKPLFSIFEGERKKNIEISRSCYPKLFAMIDDVVEQADCLKPKHVYISDECNAYVWYPNIMGYIFNGRQNLTIGLPLLTVLNKTELKAVLCHEFGHFTQKSIKMNRIANLSEYICASISRSSEEAEQADDDSYEASARLFARLASKIMTKQYVKVAPLNGILSRAQEFDADSHSYQIAGTEAAVSSLSKISVFSDQWDQAMRYLQYMMCEEKRTTTNVKMVIDTFVANANKKYKIGLTPDSHLTAPLSTITSKISWTNDDTHPSMKDRCDAILKMPAVNTKWDNDSALDFFKKNTIDRVYNAVIVDFKDVFFANRTEFLKKDISEEEVLNHVNSLTPTYLDLFYCQSIFVQDNTQVSENEECLQYGSFPFTRENATVLNEYYVAGQDLNLLKQIVDENSAGRTFFYEGVRYTGTNAPIQKHRDYYRKIEEQSAEIAKQCNWWMSRKVREDNENSFLYYFMCAAARTLDYTFALEDAVRTVNAIVQSHDKSTKAKEYVNNIDSHLRTAAKHMMEELPDGRSRFKIISEWLDVKEDVINNVTDYFASETREADYKLVDVYNQFHCIVRQCRTSAWEQLKRIWIMPEIVK